MEERAAEIGARLEIESFGSNHSVALVGEPATLECVLKNTGNATLLNPRAEFRLPTGVLDDELQPLWDAGVRFVGESEFAGAGSASHSASGEQFLRSCCFPADATSEGRRCSCC